MKKTYISPVMEVTYVVAEQMIANSVTGFGDNSVIDEIGTGDAPKNADAPANPFGDVLFDE